MSERRACKAIACDRMTMRYRSRRPDDRVLRERLRALARERRRFGYRRLLILLRREGFGVNHKRLFRIYRGTAHGAQTGRPQKRSQDEGADASPLGSERPLVV